MVTSRAIGDVPRQLVASLAGLLAAERRTRGTHNGTRALSWGTQAVFALVCSASDGPSPSSAQGWASVSPPPTAP